jgi:hypothetical protein
MFFFSGLGATSSLHPHCDQRDLREHHRSPEFVPPPYPPSFVTLIAYLAVAYQKAPARMKSVVTSMYLFTNCISSALGFCFTSVSVDPYLTGLYSGIGGAAFVAGVLFLITFRSWNATEEEENEVGNGKRTEE